MVGTEVAVDATALSGLDAEETHVACWTVLFDGKLGAIVGTRLIGTLTAIRVGLHLGEGGCVVAVRAKSRALSSSIRVHDQFKSIQRASCRIAIGLETSILGHTVHFLAIDAIETVRFRIDVFHEAVALSTLGLESSIHLHISERRKTGLEQLIHLGDRRHEAIVLLKEEIKGRLEHLIVACLAKGNFRYHHLNVCSHFRKYQFRINAMISMNESNAKLVWFECTRAFVKLDVTALNVLDVSGNGCVGTNSMLLHEADEF